MEPDLFGLEAAVLTQARAAHDDAARGADAYRNALHKLIAHYERLMRETRRLIRRSDRAELEMNQLNRQLQELAQELKYRATHDSLTGVLNCGAFIDHASRCLAQSEMVLVILDIDHFKQVNDDFGHPAGDAVIQAIVKCVVDRLGHVGAVGRVGGEEFSVAWKDDSPQRGLLIAHQVCNKIALLEHAEPIDRQITVSVGVSWNSIGTTFASAYARADQALYLAKRNGRNQVKFAPNSPEMCL